MTRQNIYTGLQPNTDSGDDLRDTFIKVEANFADLYNWLGGDSVQLPTVTTLHRNVEVEDSGYLNSFYDMYVFNNDSNMTVNLSDGWQRGQIKTLVNNGAGIVTVQPDNFAQGTSMSFNQYDACDVIWDSTNWLVLGDYIFVTVGPKAYNAVFSSMQPAAGWGFVKRNAFYIGPAATVANAADSSQTTDLFFNSNGFVVVDSAPYGDSNTRVVTLYDQFGSEDLTATISNDVRLSLPDSASKSCYLRFTGNGGLVSDRFIGPVSVDSARPSWEPENPVWALNLIRTQTFGALTKVFGVEGNPNFMEYGLWANASGTIEGRVDGSSNVVWSNTSWTADSATVRNRITRLIGDISQADSALGYQNNVLVATTPFDGKVNYDSDNDIFELGGGPDLIGNDFVGGIVEITVFNSTSPLTDSERTTLDEKLALVIDSATGVL